jgi:S-adenosylmethionine decarboxylase
MNGIEWIVEAHGCAPQSLSDLTILRALFERISRDLQLRPVGETHWHQFPLTGGITGLCLLAESHLACHTFPEFQSLCLNLFCCVPRKQWEFELLLKDMFAATSVTVRRVLRPYVSSVQPSDRRPAAVDDDVSAGGQAQ